MSVEELRNGVRKALQNRFPELTVLDHQEEEAGGKPAGPYLVVDMISAGYERQQGTVYGADYRFEIVYQANGTAEPLNLCDELFAALHLIQVEETPCRGTNMSWSRSEGIPKFQVNYRVRLREPNIQVDKMKQLTQGGSLK